MEQKINYSDSELLLYVRENNQDAKDLIYSKYSGLVHAELNKVKKTAFALGIDLSDLTQEALLAFSDAINNYDEQENVKFITFATLCIKRKLLSYIEKHSTQKYNNLRNTYDLYHVDQFDKMLVDYIKGPSDEEPLNLVLTSETADEIKRALNSLNDNERVSIELKISNVSVKEIAEIMGKSEKQVYYYLTQARNKIKDIIFKK